MTHYSSSATMGTVRYIPIVIGILLISAFGYGVYWLTSDKIQGARQASDEVKPPTQATTITQEFIEVPVVTYSEMTDSVPALRYTYTLHYPTIALLGHPNHAKATNDVIKTFILDELEDFRKNLEPDTDVLGSADATSDFTLRGTPTLLSPTIVSIRFDSAEYISGSAHSNHQTHVLIYDMERGSTLSTEELFASTTLALPTLSTIARRELRARFSDMPATEFTSATTEGSAPLLENYRAVALSREGLTIIFDPYQVAAYARGSQEILVPLTEIKNELSPRVLEALRMAESQFREATTAEFGGI